MKFLTLPADPLIRKCVIAVLILLLLVSIPLLFSLRFLHSPVTTLHESITFEVAAGSSLSRVSLDLNQAGYLRYPLLFNLLAKWRGVEDAIKTGEYELIPGLTPAQLLTQLVRGDSLQYRITLIEGWTFRQALDAIWQSDKIEKQLQSRSMAEIANLLSLDVDNPEGLLFPDTYFYTAGTSDIQLLQRASDRLEHVLATAWETRLGALPYASSYQALTLASIIEKESAVGAERGHIAGVFVRRLELGMRLQSDPTVIYGMGESYGGTIRSADLSRVTPYNTYRIDGLPPTPIALPSMESIHASLNPLPSGYLYFVAKGDGGHIFSSTLEEHNEAVNRYQRQSVVQ